MSSPFPSKLGKEVDLPALRPPRDYWEYRAICRGKTETLRPFDHSFYCSFAGCARGSGTCAFPWTDAAARRLKRSRAEVIRQAIEYYLDDLEDLRLSLERLQDPADPGLDWDEVKRDLLAQDLRGVLPRLFSESTDGSASFDRSH